MPYGRLVPMIVAVALLAGGRGSAPVRAQGAEMVPAELGTLFVLGVGETARIEPEGLEITLRSISDDSGCIAPNDCSVMLFKGTLALRLEEQRELAEVDASIEPDSPASVTFVGYEIELTAARRTEAKGPLLVTFKVRPKPQEDQKMNETRSPGV